MHEEIVKGLRFVLLTQAALLFLGFTLFQERSDANADMLTMEKRIVALKLLNLSASEARTSELTPFTDEDTEKLDDAWRYYDLFSKTNELEGLGQLEQREPWNLYREAAMIGGGKLYFTACSSLTGAEANIWQAMTNLIPVSEEKPIVDGQAQGNKNVSGQDSPDGQRRVFVLPVTIEKGKHGPSDILGDVFRLLFTNLHPVYRPEHQDYVAAPGPLRVRLPEDESAEAHRWRDADELRADLLKIGRRRGVAVADANDSFLRTLALFENQRVKIPVLDAEVGADSASFLILAVSVGLAAWGSFLMRAARNQGEQFKRKPWIFLEPLVASAGYKWPELTLVTAERLLFFNLYLVGIFAPVGLAVLPWLGNLHEGIRKVWLVFLGLFALAFAVSGCCNYFGLRSKRSKAPARESEAISKARA